MPATPIPTSLQQSLDESKVEYVKLGASGLRVSSPILGGMSFGSKEWAPWLLDEEESLKLLKAAWDRGINTWDTADMYCGGLSEQILGKAIRQFNIPREKLVIMTKCSMHVPEKPPTSIVFFREQLNQTKDYVNRGGLSRSAIFKAVDASLQRLGLDYIDVLQVHRFDEQTPIEETMRALHDLVQAGKVRYLGASSMYATQFARMQFVAEQRGWTPFVSMQNYYNLCYREEEREMNNFCRETGVGLIPWSPLLSGRLARPVGYDASVRSKKPSGYDNGTTPADEEIIRRVEKVAADREWKMSHVALAWLRSKSAVPIVGLNSVDRINEACEVRGKKLTEEEIKYLEESYVPKPIQGHA